MDSLELLNVLDVIKNEEVYKVRLEQLKKVQSKLDESQYIVKTVELAQKKLDDADILQKKYKLLVEKLEQDLKLVRGQVEKEYQDKVAAVQARERKSAEFNDAARKMLHEAQDMAVKQEKERKVLLEWDEILRKKEADINQVERLMTSKFSRIKSIIEE